jgi:hypothetical protein
LFSFGFQNSSIGTFWVGVVTAFILPVVVNAVGVVVVKMKHNICAPSSGGVTVAIATVPLMKVRKTCGATVAADAIVLGLGANTPATVDKFWKLRSFDGI